MARRRTARAPRRRGRRSLPAIALVGLAITTLVVVAGITGTPDRGGPTAGPAPDDTASPAATASPSASLGGLDVSNLPVARAPFCDVVDDEAVEEALGGPVRSQRDWADGDRVRLEDGLVDVAHEFGCAFTGATAEARAWVFAAPVTTSEARALVRAARARDGCTPPEAAPVFGRPGTTTVCRSGTRADPAVEVTAQGLFGDAWLTCRLTARPTAGETVPEVTERAERWCVHLVTTLGARP